VWALTPVIGQADEKRCELGVGCVGLEADGVWAEVFEMSFVSFQLQMLGSVGLGRFRHVVAPLTFVG
jgi:hypothetical protein